MRAVCPETEELLARAALFRALARGFAYPEDGHARALARDFARLRAGGGAREFSPLAARVLARAARAWRSANDGACAAGYMRLFLGSGPVSLHETAYGDGRRIAGRPAELADLNGFYHAFGFTIGQNAPDLPDHLAVELEFLSLLLVRESYAVDRRLRPQARVTAEAAATFLEHHLGRWVGAFAQAMAEAGAGSPYHELAALCVAAVDAECRRRRARPHSVPGRLPPDVMQSETLTCPQAAGMA